MTFSQIIRLALVASTSCASITIARAQDKPTQVAAAPAPTTGDIVVTAQKRSESAQKTALAISAVSGDTLVQRQITGIESLAPTLPNVTFGEDVGIARVAIRGLGTDTSVPAQEGRVAFSTDGVYLSRTTVPLSTFFDINRVEVVYGPQGTLYGRNATAGAVNVITNDPSQTFGGYVRLTAGNYGLFTEEGALTGPLSDKVSARIAFTRTDRDGYGENLTTGQQIDNDHSGALRAKIKIEPTNNIKWVVSADYFKEDDAAFVYHYLGEGSPTTVPTGIADGGSVPSNPRDTYANTPQSNHRVFYGFGSDLNINLGAVDVTSVTGLRHSFSNLYGDHDGTQVGASAIRELEDAAQFSQELRLNGSISNVNWIVGAYYFKEHIYGEADFSPVLLGSFLSQGLNFNGHFTTTAGAAFGQLEWKATDRLTLTGGLRYSDEKRAVDQQGDFGFGLAYTPGFTPTVSAIQDTSTKFSSVTPKVTLKYQIAPKVMTYATYSQGFKSGGFSLTDVYSPAVKPEKLVDYEIGLKSDLLNGLLRLNASAFIYDYTNLQVQEILAAGAIFVNAQSANVKGLEGEIVLHPAPGFEISGNAAYLDSKFTNFVLANGDPSRPALGAPLSLAGNELPESPKYKANLAAQYTFTLPGGKLALRGELSYTDRVYFSPFQRLDVSQGAYAKGNILATYTGDYGLSVSLFIRNVANLRTISSAQVSSGFIGYPIMGTFDPPRTFGGSIGYRF